MIIPYVGAVGEIEAVVKTTPISIGGITGTDVWDYAHTEYGLWYKVDAAYWQTVLIIQPLNATKLIIPKSVMVSSKIDDVGVFRLVRSPVYSTYDDGEANWITSPSGNVRFTQGHKDWEIDITGDQLNAIDLLLPDTANRYEKILATIPFDEELEYTTVGEQAALIGRKMGGNPEVVASIGWIERTPT